MSTGLGDQCRGCSECRPSARRKQGRVLPRQLLEATPDQLGGIGVRAELSGGDVVETYRAVEGELGQYSDALKDRPRWLVLNKLDLLPPEQRKKRTAAIVKKLKWKGPVYGISALTADGTKRLVQDVMSYLEGQRKPEATAQPSRHGA